MLALAATALVLLASGGPVQARQMRVAIVTDGPAGRELIPISVVEQEVANVGAPGFDVAFPVDKRFVGDWSLSGIQSALDRALQDSDVDLVLTLGVLASHQAAQHAVLSKPVIAPFVVDPSFQGYPYQNGKSGRRNFTYVTNLSSVENQVRTFLQVVGFRHLAILVDDASLTQLPELSDKATKLAAALDVHLSIVKVRADPAAALAAVPAEADAVYVTGLRQFSSQDMRTLADGLVARRLPSFAMRGRNDLESGLLLATGDAQRDGIRLARRVLLMIQRIAQGEDPAEFDVDFPTEQRLAINMQTARAIGFSLRWQFLTDAEQLYPEGPEAVPALSLAGAMRAALDANPSLAASRARLDSSADDVAIARSNLLPSIDANAGRTKIDADRASPLTQAENTMVVGASAQQIIYSESAWAGYSISRSLFEASRQGQRRDMLDTLQSAASAYLDVLRAKSIESVRHSSVENTRKNLEISKVRESVGLSGHSDYLRWVAQLARDKRSMLEAEATRRQAETELSRIIHRPASEPYATVESGLDDPLQLVASPRTQAFLDSPARWSIFSGYVVHEALQESPEIAQTAAQVAARQRAVTAARRGFYLPDISLVAKGSSTEQKSGAGALTIPGAPDDRSWSVSLQASLPIFAGGLRRAELSQARHDLRASEADRVATTDAIETRARAVLYRAASSYPSLELSRESAAAANENFAMVTDAYARGAVTVTDLIDAQDAALSADLGATDARYGFLNDFIDMLRTIGQFDLLLDPSSRESWLQRVDAWFRDHQSASNPQSHEGSR